MSATERHKKWAQKNKQHLREYQKQYRQKNHSRIVATHKRYRTAQRLAKWLSNQMKAKYGITLDEYNAMVEKQKGVCAICFRPPKKSRLSIDHCHATNKIRGLLCEDCNHGLGQFRDNPIYLRCAANYLEGKLWVHT